MRHKPFIECFVGGKAVAPGFYDRLSTATVTDNAGQEADRIELVFDDSGNAIQIPEKGAKLSVSFGYKEFGSWVMGEFTVEKNRINFGPDGDKLTISGHSADMREDVKEQGSEHFDHTTIGDVVEQLAKRHGYDAKVSPELASKQIEYIARVGQSSLDFLTRLADRNRALFSIKGNKFLFLSRGILPTITIDKSECESGDFEVEPRTKFGKVEASYFDRATGKTETVSHSTGLKGPVRRLRTVYATKAEAEAAAGSARPRNRLRQPHDVRPTRADGRHALEPHRLSARGERGVARRNRHPDLRCRQLQNWCCGRSAGEWQGIEMK
jgi:phage protein D